MSWLVPEVRVGDISLPVIRQCDVDDPDDDGDGSRIDIGGPSGTSDVKEAQQLEVRPHQLTWCVMTDSDNDDSNENRGNLPREGALQLSGGGNTSGLGSSFLAVPWSVPRRRHSWICR